MVQFNALQKEMTYKIVYYGPASSGKTTNLKILEQKIFELVRGKLSTIVVMPKENLVIDFLPLEIAILPNAKTRFNIFAVPGGAAYQNIRKLFLQEVDGIVFIADSTKLEENLFALQELGKNLQELGMLIQQIPLVIQWNKRDLPEAMDLKKLHQEVNLVNVSEFAGIATKSQGVVEALERLISSVVQNSAKNRQGIWKNLSNEELATLENGITLRAPERDRGITTSVIANQFLDRMTQTRMRLPPATAESLTATAVANHAAIQDDKNFSLEEAHWDSPSSRVTILKIAGRIGPSNCNQIKAKVLDQYMRGRFRLILDFTKVEHIHSSGFGMLIELGNRAQILGGGVALVGIQDKFKIVFDLMGTGRAICIAQNEEQALAFFSNMRKTGESPDTSVLPKKGYRALQSQLSATQKARASDLANIKRNIYISYAPRDGENAQKLEKLLEQKGYGISRDNKRMSAEVLWNLELGQTLLASDVLILLWSKEAASNTLVQQEWCLGRALGKNIVAWVTAEGPMMPLGIQEITIIETPKEEVFVQQLLEKKLLEQKTIYNYNLLPYFSYVPINSKPSLIGRDAYLLELYAKLLLYKHVILGQEEAFEQTEGIGKTSLAMEFVYRFGVFFHEGVICISGNGKNWESELQRIAYELGLIQIHPENQTHPSGMIELQNYIQKKTRLLLVVDFLLEAQDITKPLVPGLVLHDLNCYILCIVHRHQSIPGITHMRLGALSPEAALQFLTNFRMPSTPMEMESGKKLCELVAGVPLALFLIARYLAKNPQETFNKYFQELFDVTSQSTKSSLKDALRIVPNYAILFSVIIRKLWENLPQEYAKAMLEAAALLPPGKVIFKDALFLWAGVAYESRQDIFELLQSLGLLEKVGEEFTRLPRIIHHFLCQTMNREHQQNKQKKIAERVLAFYQDFNRIEKEYERYGLQYILNTMEPWVDSNDELRILYQTLQKDLALLNQRTNLPYFFIQQVYSRIIAENDPAFNLLKKLEQSLTKVTWQPNTLWLKRTNRYLALESETPSSNHTIAASFSWDGNYVAFTNHREIVIWDTQAGRKSQVLWPGHCYTQSLMFIPRKNRLVAAHGNRVRLWDFDKIETSSWLVSQQDWVLALAVSENILVCAGKEQKIYFKNLDRVGEAVFPKVHEGSIIKLCLNQDGTKMLSAGQDRRIYFWDMENQKPIYFIKNESQVATSLAFCPERAIFASGFQNGHIHIYQAQEGNLISILMHCQNKITSLCFSPDTQYIAATSENALNIWNWSNGKLVQKFLSPNMLISCQFSPDGAWIWMGDQKALVYKFRLMKIS